MTLYGIGLGPGDAGLVTVRGTQILADADVVYSPGRLSRAVATEHVPEERIGDVDFPMTRDPAELRRAWKAAAAEIAPTARDGTAAFVTLGDPNVYSTYGHLRRTLDAFHPEVAVETVPGVSAVTAFTSALGVEITAGASLALHEAAGGVAPTGPDRMVLFKVTDAPATHEGLVEAGYDVVYGRRLFMAQGETRVTDDPDDIAERDYYTLAYAEKQDLDEDAPATAAFDAEADAGGRDSEDGSRDDGDGTTVPPAATTDGGRPDGTASTREPGRESLSDVAVRELAESASHGDDVPEVPPR